MILEKKSVIKDNKIDNRKYQRTEEANIKKYIAKLVYTL